MSLGAIAPHAQSIVEVLQSALAAEIKRTSEQREGAKRHHLWASEWHPCRRHLFLRMTRPEALPPPDAELLARFKRGREREVSVRQWLERAGLQAEPPFSVEAAQQRVEIGSRSGKVIVTGKIDGDLVFTAQRIPFDIKSWPRMYERVDSVEDLERSPWTRGAEIQLLAYLYARALPVGLLILDTPALPKFIEVQLEDGLEKMERFLADAEAVCPLAEAENDGGSVLPPDFIQDVSECRRCAFFGSACTPPLDFGPGAQIITATDVIEEVTREVALDAEIGEKRREYDRLHKKNAERFRGVDNAIVGDHLVQGAWQPRTTYDMPSEVKAPYKVIHEQGAWTMKITPLKP